MKVLTMVLTVLAVSSAYTMKPNRSTDFTKHNEFYMGLLETMLKWSPDGAPTCLDSGQELWTTSYDLMAAILTAHHSVPDLVYNFMDSTG